VGVIIAIKYEMIQVNVRKMAWQKNEITSKPQILEMASISKAFHSQQHIYNHYRCIK